MKAVYKGVVLAESDQTIVVEGNHYFPPQSVDMTYFITSGTLTTCSWKGEASYYHVVVDGEMNRDAAWYYPEPKQAAKQVKGYLAFWRGVAVQG